ncbi:MAG: DUF1295 domain-containing protein, partial [Asgard group archaeon]|nr:DUF1295 domain-containing protein [Asgard group archaeon]
SGKDTKKSIGTTTLSAALICIFSFITYVALNRFSDLSLLAFLSVGALLATPFGPLRTKYLEERNGRTVVGVLTLGLGIFMITKTLVWPYISIFVLNPFFWALISMFAFIGSSVTLVSKNLGYYPRFNLILVVIFFLGRFIMVLPYCPQPRFDIFNLHLYIGGVIFIIGLVFLTPLFIIRSWPKPDAKIKLVTTGFYAITRNPIYLGEILWSLGWAIMFKSIIGVACIPLWWGGFLFHVILEEEDLERKLGKKYLKYKEKVIGRIFPYLPI